MKRYENYKCSECCTCFEVFEGKAVEECSCGGDAFRHLSVPGLVFRGTGFYKTDYGVSDGKNKTS